MRITEYSASRIYDTLGKPMNFWEVRVQLKETLSSDDAERISEWMNDHVSVTLTPSPSQSASFPAAPEPDASNTVVRFDPKTQKFQSWAIPGGGNIVRNTSVTRDGDFLLANSLTNEVTLVRIGKPSR